jgi:hypothetical protein
MKSAAKILLPDHDLEIDAYWTKVQYPALARLTTNGMY